MTSFGLIGWTPVSPGYPSPIALSDGYAFVGDLGGVLHVFDLRDPVAPTIVATFRYPSSYNNEIVDVDVFGDDLYISYDAFGLVKVDISDPLNPTFVSARKDGSYAGSFDTDDGAFGYVTYGYQYGTAPEVQVYDLATFPSGPVSSYAGYGDGDYTSLKQVVHGSSVDVVGDRMYVGITENYVGPFLEIVDVSDPYAPIRISSLVTPTNVYGDWQGVIEVSGDYAYWARGAYPPANITGGLLTIDISDEENPAVADFDGIGDAGSYGLPGGGGGPGLDIVGDQLFMASRTGLYIYDLTDPADPEVVIDPNVDTEFAFPDAFLPSRGGWVQVENGFAYVTARYDGDQGGLAVFDVSEDVVCDLFREKDFGSDSGDVTFSNTVDGLRVAVTGQDGWLVAETKLHLGEVDTATGEVSGFPVNKAGNPKVGHFDFVETKDADDMVFEFTLAELAAADTDDDGIVAIAVHAEVEAWLPDGDGGVECVTASAWGACDGVDLDFGGASHAYVMQVDLADLGLIV